ncbi:hypothetical protein DFAR_1310016 [Desulfarculales bacterium]
MLERRSITKQMLPNVAYYSKWPTSHGMGGPLAVESVGRLKRNSHMMATVSIAQARSAIRELYLTGGDSRELAEALTDFIPHYWPWPRTFPAYRVNSRCTWMAWPSIPWKSWCRWSCVSPWVTRGAIRQGRRGGPGADQNGPLRPAQTFSHHRLARGLGASQADAGSGASAPGRPDGLRTALLHRHPGYLPGGVPGARGLLGRLEPQRFYDLIVEISLFRPGPMRADLVNHPLRGASRRPPPGSLRPSPNWSPF